MLKIRLQRVGRKHDPSFRVVLTDSKNGPKSGKFIEILGTHNPRTDQTVLKGDSIKSWIEKGAGLSETLHNLLIEKKIITGKKINVLPKKKPIISEEAKAKEEESKKAEAPASESESSSVEAPTAEAPTEDAPAEAHAPVEEASVEEEKATA